MDLNEQINYLLDNADAAIHGTVADLLREPIPGSEKLTTDELLEIVGRIHHEAIQKFLAGGLKAEDATVYEWRLIAREIGALRSAA